MMADFGGCGDDRRRRIPGAEVGTVEPHAARRDMEEGGHDDAGVGTAVHPLIARQAVDPFGDQTVVGPARQLHHRSSVGGRGDGVEQTDRWKARRHQPVGRTGRSDELLHQLKTISLSS
ncbi:hypothetical protein D3C73_1425120 [compost metagenome]